MQALAPKSKCFLDFNTLLPFLSHYDISCDEVQCVAKEMLSNTDLNSLHDVYCLLAPVSSGYPSLLQTLQIAVLLQHLLNDRFHHYVG